MWSNTSTVLVGADDTSWFWDHPTWNWVMGLHSLVWLLPAVLAIGAVALLIYSFVRDRSAARASSLGATNVKRKSALDILQAGYAKGELERSEYLRKKHDLS